MSINNRAEYYKKLLNHIVFIFCLLFILFLNVLRFYQLKDEKKPIPQEIISKPIYISFVLFQSKGHPHMIFLQDQNNINYFKTAFKNIVLKKGSKITLINCAPDNFQNLTSFLSQKFPKASFSKEKCEISQDLLQKKYNNHEFLVFILNNHYLTHKNALHFAYQNQLKPELKIVEIKK